MVHHLSADDVGDPSDEEEDVDNVIEISRLDGGNQRMSTQSQVPPSLSPNSGEVSGKPSLVANESKNSVLSKQTVGSKSSSKICNCFGYGSGFLSKYGALVKTGMPKVLIRYHQVQINEMCARIRDQQEAIDEL